MLQAVKRTTAKVKARIAETPEQRKQRKEAAQEAKKKAHEEWKAELKRRERSAYRRGDSELALLHKELKRLQSENQMLLDRETPDGLILTLRLGFLCLMFIAAHWAFGITVLEPMGL